MDSIYKYQEYSKFTVELGKFPGPSTKTIAVIDAQPIPRVGDIIMHEDFQIPLVVTHVAWGIHRKYPYAAEVFVQKIKEE